MPVLGLHCYTLSFPSFGEWGLLFDVMGGLLTAVAPLDGKHRLQGFRSFGSWAPECGLGRCGARAQQPHSMRLFLDQRSDRVSWTGGRILSHWSTREVLSPSYKDTSRKGSAAHSVPGRPRLGQSPLRSPDLQVRPHSEGLGVRASPREFGRETQSTHNRDPPPPRSPEEARPCSPSEDPSKPASTLKLSGADTALRGSQASCAGSEEHRGPLLDICHWQAGKPEPLSGATESRWRALLGTVQPWLQGNRRGLTRPVCTGRRHHRSSFRHKQDGRHLSATTSRSQKAQGKGSLHPP